MNQLSREQKLQQIQQLKEKIEQGRKYLQNLDEFGNKHNLVFTPGVGYRVVKPVVEEPITNTEKQVTNEEVPNVDTT